MYAEPLPPLGAGLPSAASDAAKPRHFLDASQFWVPEGAGGVKRMITAKRLGLAQRGWRHTLLAPCAAGPGEVSCGGVRIPRSGGYRFVLDRTRAARLMVRQAPDLVEAADPYVLGWSALDACADLRIPAIAFCHCNLPALLARFAGGPHTLRGQQLQRWAGRYLRDLYSRFDLVMAPSLHMAGILREAGVPRVVCQPLGVDCLTFTPAAKDLRWRTNLLDRLGLPAQVRLLVYHGRFAPEKNLPLLSQAIDGLGDGHAFLAVGNGPCPPRGLRVRVLPAVHDDGQLARLVASCDAFVHAGDQETFGLAALEAMACGVPVVVSARAGLGELAKEVGITVLSDRPGVWADAMHSALGAEGLALASLALQRARAHDWPHIVEQLTRHYQALLTQ